MLCETKPI